VSAGAPRSALRRVAGASWSFRYGVEREAELRFASFAERLAGDGASPALVDLARRASGEERRHAELCAAMAGRYGAALPEPVRQLPEIAPRRLSPRDRLIYEIVAACCVTETESMGVLTTLIGAAGDEELLCVLRERASDEVRHARLGWAHLATAHARGATAFLGPLVPHMLQGSLADDLFAQAPRELEDPALLEHGVLPRAMKREVFTRTLEEVVFPGLEEFGVDAGPGRSWLEARRADLAASARPRRSARRRRSR